MGSSSLLTSIVDGILIGVIYGIAAMGLTLIWGVMDVINLSHGAIIALGMFIMYFFFSVAGLSPYLAFLLVAIAGLLLGIIIYFIAIHRVLNAPSLSTLLATFSVNMIIIGTGTAFLSTSPRNIDFSLGKIHLGGITILGTRLVSALIAVLVAGGLYLFLYRTRLGKYVRAVANNRSAAELMGIPSTQILAFSFGLGAMLAAIAGALIASLLPFTILAGGAYELKSFVIGVLGGLGNPLGSLAGGLILGLLESLVPIFMPNTWVPVIEFILFVITLLFLPNGLFGESE